MFVELLKSIIGKWLKISLSEVLIFSSNFNGTTIEVEVVTPFLIKKESSQMSKLKGYIHQKMLLTNEILGTFK